MKILAFEDLPTATKENFDAYGQEEAKHVWDLYQSGVIRGIYFRADKNEAVLVLECQEGENYIGNNAFRSEETNHIRSSFSKTISRICKTLQVDLCRIRIGALR